MPSEDGGHHDLEELDFTTAGDENNRPAPPKVTFSLGPPSSTNPAEDSGMMDDNDMTVSFLPQHQDASDGLSASQLAAAAGNRHSPLRLVLRRIGNWLAAATLTLMLIFVPIVAYKALKQRKLDTAAYDSAAVMVLGTVILSLRLVYTHFTHW